MVTLYKKIKFFYKDNQFYFSLVPPLFMGTLHLVACIMHYDWLILNYCIFSYLLALFKVWQWSIEKFHLRPREYFSGAISILLLIVPMMVCFVGTILYRDAPHYFISWFIYAYALYGTIKMVLAIKKLLERNKTKREFVIAFFGLLSACYTIQMMEFSLIMTFDEAETDYDMYLMQLFTQGFIFLLALLIFGLFIYKFIKDIQFERAKTI